MDAAAGRGRKCDPEHREVGAGRGEPGLLREDKRTGTGHASADDGPSEAAAAAAQDRDQGLGDEQAADHHGHDSHPGRPASDTGPSR